MADIHEVLAVVKYTDEPISIRVEKESSANFIERTLKTSDAFGEVHMRQEF